MPKGGGTIYACAKCEAQFPKWAGRCESCGAWGSLHEENAIREESREKTPNVRPGSTKSFGEKQSVVQAKTIPTGFAPFDSVLGGGCVEGGITLIFGEPGIGKSTLLAQVALTNATTHGDVLYITGEESPAQIHKRLERLANSIPESFRFLEDTDAEVIAATLEKEKPKLTIIDSIQSLSISGVSGETGSINQIKASAATIAEVAKRLHLPVLFVGQVTKDGDIAGPRALEHLVDTVLTLEGDRLHRYRILRALKHRFGPTDEAALLAMTERGLEVVEDVSTELLRDRARGVSGSTVTCLLEGHRPLLIEIQALVTTAGYGTPVRRTTGIDSARLGMLIAVLSRRAGVQVLDQDVYANAAGGIDARDPSTDLAVAVAIASARFDRPIDPRTAMIGEIGLAGELRPVRLIDTRLKEMARLGFSTVLIPKGQKYANLPSLTIHECGNLGEVMEMLGLK